MATSSLMFHPRSSLASPSQNPKQKQTESEFTPGASDHAAIKLKARRMESKERRTLQISYIMIMMRFVYSHSAPALPPPSSLLVETGFRHTSILLPQDIILIPNYIQWIP